MILGCSCLHLAILGAEIFLFPSLGFCRIYWNVILAVPFSAMKWTMSMIKEKGSNSLYSTKNVQVCFEAENKSDGAFCLFFFG